jgi:hypothetical protein
MIEADFRNSVTASELNSTDLVITLNAEVVLDSTNKGVLYEAAIAGIDGTLVFTNGAVSTTFTFGKLQIPDNTPTVQNKSRIPYNISLTARNDGSDDAIVITNDATT